ncbi:hypothetical protein ANCDUO_16955 [Ancylostoma duodenale]|uniref:Uncharacterized protein n=1 Tax=Ancylostoma duodenale TaxID=51022 RepID=A0A0C2CT16_9BILA|nr:hypothetical protein ANCDUO_16955 [Ancylostoma duodenale]
MKARKEAKGHLITEHEEAKHLEWCKRLRKRFAAGRHRKILFSDKKWFDVEGDHNRQNDRVWLKGKPSLAGRMVTKRQKAKQVMVRAGITYTSKTPLIFAHEGVKVQEPQYCALLENKVLPWASRYFGEEV